MIKYTMPTKIQLDDKTLIEVADLPQPVINLIETKMRWDAEFADVKAKHDLASTTLQSQLTDAITKYIKGLK